MKKIPKFKTEEEEIKFWETHSVGKSKAKFLRSFGFNEMNIDMLVQGLISIAHSGDIKDVLSSCIRVL